MAEEAANNPDGVTPEMIEASKVILGQALQYLQEVQQFATEDPARAKAAFNALKSLPSAPMPAVATVISQIVLSADIAGNPAENQVESAGVVIESASSLMQRYPSMRCMSKQMQDFFTTELAASKYQSADVQLDKDGKVVSLTDGAELKGDTVRDAFVDVSKHGMMPEEKQKLPEGENKDQPFTPESAEKLHESLRVLERYKMAKLKAAGGDRDEQMERATELHESFERAHKQVDRAAEAERERSRAERAAAERAAGRGNRPGSPGGPNDGDNKQDLTLARTTAVMERAKLQAGLREDIIEGAVMQPEGQKRQITAGMDVKRHGPAQIIGARQSGGELVHSH